MKDNQVLEYVVLSLKDIDDNMNFYSQVEDKNSFMKLLLEYIENHKQTIMNHIFANNDFAMKKYLLNNFVKPTLFKETSSDIEKSEPLQKLVLVEEPKLIRKGRPKGSKNKPKEIIINIPVHSVNDQNYIDAIKDILWYRSGITAKTIVDHLDCDESITKFLYAKLHENNNIHWVERRIKNRYGKYIYLWFPIDERKGYFYNGKLRSITNIAECISMNKVTLWKRIKSGMNHIEAINKPIDDKMVRNAKKS